jgi:hypothetical protein
VTDRAHVHVRLGAGEFTFCHFSILERAFPCIGFMSAPDCWFASHGNAAAPDRRQRRPRTA